MPFLGLYRKGEIEQVVEAALKKAGSSEYASWLLQTAEATRFRMPDLTVYENQANLYRSLSYLRTGIDITSRAAASTPGGVYRLRGEKKRAIINHDFEMLLDKPNPMDSRDEILFAIYASYKTNGNGYWWLNRESESAKTDEIWFIPPHTIIPVPDEQMYLRGYMLYPGNGQEIPLEPWEILHIKSYNPFNRFVGLSMLESLVNQAVGSQKMQEWNVRFFAENNARLPGILAFKQFINDADWDRLKQEARSSAAKRDMLMLRGAGDGVNWMQAASSLKDMEYLAGLNENKEDIWATVAPGLASIVSVNATEANAIAGAATFNSYSIYPLHRTLQAKITNGPLIAYGLKLVYEFDDVRWQDRQLEIQEIDQYSKFHTLKEVRENKYNDDPLGDGRDAKIADGNLPTQIQPVTEPPMNPDEQVMDEENQEESTESEEELQKFQRKSLKALERGKSPAVDFFSDVIPIQQVMELQGKLSTCKTADHVLAVFRRETVTPAQNYEVASILEAMRLEVAGIKASRA